MNKCSLGRTVHRLLFSNNKNSKHCLIKHAYSGEHSKSSNVRFKCMTKEDTDVLAILDILSFLCLIYKSAALRLPGNLIIIFKPIITSKQDF